MRNRIKQVVLDSYHIGCKDLLEFVRDRMMVISFVIMPIFMMVMIGFIFPEENILRGIPLGIVNQDDGDWSKILQEQLAQAELEKGEKPFILRQVASKDEAIKQIKSQELSGAIVIPEHFSQELDSGKQGRVTILTDQSNPQISTMLSTMLERMINALSTQFATQKLAQQEGVTPEEAEASVQPFVVAPENIVRGELSYFQFMAPGMMAIVVVMAVVMGLPGAIARERELGTLDGILVAPAARLSIILGKTFAQTVRGLLQGMLVLGLAMLLFGITVHGSILLIIFLLILGVFSFIGLGVLISAISSQQETAMIIMMSLTFPLFFLSGAFFPIQQMPSWLQGVSQIIPLTYVVQALRKVIIFDAGLPAVTTEVIILASFGAVMLLIAVPLFNRIITR